MKKLLCLIVIIYILLISNISLANTVNLNVRFNDIIVLINYIEIINTQLKKETTVTIAREILYQCDKFNLPWEVVACMATEESHFDPNAVSSVGAIGIMQIYTLKCNGEKFDKEKLKDIKYNINCGLKLLKSKIMSNDGDIVTGIMRYNGAGEEAVKYLTKISLRLIYFTEFKSRYYSMLGEN